MGVVGFGISGNRNWLLRTLVTTPTSGGFANELQIHLNGEPQITQINTNCNEEGVGGYKILAD